MGLGIGDLKTLISKIELTDIPGLLTSGLLDSMKMRPMARRFSIKAVDCIVEHFGSQSILPYLGNIIAFIVEACKDQEVHVQNSAVASVASIAPLVMSDEIFQLNPDVVNLFFDPLLQLAKKNVTPSTQLAAITAIGAAIDGVSLNLTVMFLQKFVGQLLPLAGNPNIMDSCKAVVIDILKKIVTVIWIFLKETPFGSSPYTYDIKSEGNSADNIHEDLLISPITWKDINQIFSVLIKEINTNFTSICKNVNVKIASISLFTEIMMCCFVAQAGMLIAANESSVPLRKSLSGLKHFAETIIHSINMAVKEKSPKVREVANFCLKKIQEANEIYLPKCKESSSDYSNLVDVSLIFQSVKQFNSENIANNQKKKINKDFFNNATDEIVVRHISPPPSNCKGQVLQEQSSEDSQESSLAKNFEDDSNFQDAVPEQICSGDKISNEPESCNNKQMPQNPPPVLISSPTNLENTQLSYLSTMNNTSTSPMFVITAPPMLTTQMCSHPNQSTQEWFEKQIDSMRQEISVLKSRQIEVENIAHVLKMVAISRVDRLEDRLQKLSALLLESESENTDINVNNCDKTSSKFNCELENSRTVNQDIRKSLYMKAKKVIDKI
ncbi:HEAT repeat family protein [Cryptosporidium muris RN66]|uniref:HEAT repeat family protein n=1 Tax=Cryptosporidium muris (strain RN66) TaxID=441375 RepID=B6AFM8_CRYMR|nr:HEAT repeat family protein [Cryptosporidium muris RN66]EEA07019.1 HEAT repeat family protein [Cryptosporidium muris RN66]|eukprot:XP_002141368.1 HEAT repeat family protein [Cryptosporidium muris RN66]